MSIRHPYYLETAGYNPNQWNKLRTVDLNMKHKLPVTTLELLNSTKAAQPGLENRISARYSQNCMQNANFEGWHILDIFAFCNAFKPATHWNTGPNEDTKAPFIQTYPWKNFNSPSNVKLYLYLTVLKEFWGAISNVDDTWGPNRKNEPLFIWTRHFNHESKDGSSRLVTDWATVFGAQSPNQAAFQFNGNLENKFARLNGGLQKIKPKLKGTNVGNPPSQQSGNIMEDESLTKWPRVSAKASEEPDAENDENIVDFENMPLSQRVTRSMSKKAGDAVDIEPGPWGKQVLREAEFVDSPFKNHSNYDFENDLIEDDHVERGTTTICGVDWSDSSIKGMMGFVMEPFFAKIRGKNGKTIAVYAEKLHEVTLTENGKFSFQKKKR
ncbi:hypothetical protein N7540_003333 [Penicillium herquei]|nr:hypothetical protein N7540_003333 [Penicillium herquei]